MFYRVENGEGLGPYVGQGGDKSLQEMHRSHNWDLENHPSPYEDEGIRNQFRADMHLCGSSSLEKLMEWFEGFGQVLDEAGYRVYVYDAPIIEGAKQAVASIHDVNNRTLVDSFSTIGL